ncbi:urea transporter [Pseudomonas sp. LPB0260]|uniref:urea transporter n=1 Tax=Pseudomonas sp. LPB0260 TaxID=2614442 RepID=UPI0015C1CF0E|nr:urea transporter [Pseudomonas sp. LPB0260]QLC74688.1 urea transporter [Pseudomonas sp. LPB0260]
MQWVNRALEPLGFLDGINVLFRGISQVMFVNSPLVGLLITLAIGLHDSALCLMGLWGCFWTTLLAARMSGSTQALHNGAIGFSGALIGFALFTLSARFDQVDMGLWLLLVVPLSYLNVVLIYRFGSWFVSQTGLPFFTLPYNFTVYLLIAVTAHIWPAAFEGAAKSFESGGPLGGQGLFEAVLVNFGQVFFVDNLSTSLLILCAVTLCSPIAALLGLLGATLFVVVSQVVGFDTSVIRSGVVGYNTVLTAVVVGGVVHIATFKAVVVATVAATLSAVISLSIAVIMLPIGVPVLTLPFCLATILSLFVIRKYLPGQLCSVLNEFATPEENRVLYKGDISRCSS